MKCNEATSIFGKEKEKELIAASQLATEQRTVSPTREARKQEMQILIYPNITYPNLT